MEDRREQERAAVRDRTAHVRDAITGRSHWTMEGDTALYVHPGHGGRATVHGHGPTHGDLAFYAAVGPTAAYRGGPNPLLAMRRTAGEAVQWVENVVQLALAKAGGG